MSVFRRLIGEAHRRSLWQVLSIYLAVSWVVLQVVEVVTESAGLPDWTRGFAFVLLLLGLPVVMATAFVQEGIPGAGEEDDEPPPRPAVPNLSAGTGSLDFPSTRRPARHRLLTWRNALVGGAGAFSIMGVSLVGYLAMWSSGIGPVGSLVAQGSIEEGDEVVLAEFRNTSNDPSLGSVVTEALRVDLAGAQNVRLVQPQRVREILGLMERGADEPLTADMAREVAVRDGIEAVLHGEVGSAGSGYILVASLQAAGSGEVLATFRRTAESPEGVIGAIDKLSQDIRERTGESLRRIRAEEPLHAYTTSSLEALKKYAEAERILEAGDARRALTLLEEAVALDPEFAMAWRKRSVALQSAGGSLAEQAAAATRAWELRDRLTDVERYLATAYYHQLVTGDVDAQIEAYESVIGGDPDDRTALNNLAIVLRDRTRYPESVELLRRAVDGPGRSAPAFTNLVEHLAHLPDVAAAREAQARARDRYPRRDQWNAWIDWNVSTAGGDQEEAHAVAEGLAGSPDAPASWRSAATVMKIVNDAAAGRMAEARRHVDEDAVASERDGRHEDVLLSSRFLGRLEELVHGNGGAASARIGAALEGGRLDSIPPAGRPYAHLATTLAVAGDFAAARAVLDHWETRGGPTTSGTARREAIRIVDILEVGASDPAAAAAGLEAFRRERNCPRCWTWELAEFHDQAGRPDRAAELWAAVIAEPEMWQTAAVQTVLAHERLGRLHDEGGDAARATEHYRAFVEAWADADAELQPRVRHARERRAALGG